MSLRWIKAPQRVHFLVTVLRAGAEIDTHARTART